MKNLYFFILFYSIQVVGFATSGNAYNNLNNTNSECVGDLQSPNFFNTPPIAVDDTFYLLAGCGEYQISGNVLENDYDPNGDPLVFYFSNLPKIGIFSINKEGVFNLTVPKGFAGSITFEYYIREKSEREFNALGQVTVYVEVDSDCDRISDEIDIDDDNDGILDVDEGYIDTDNDGLVNSRDIDSDNDGITDNVEWQAEGYYILPSQIDVNKNGWDDAYDTFLEGNYYSAEDTNNDGVPDYIDVDSDNDGITDFIEAFDVDNDGKPNIFPFKKDTDMDGLDDAFDVIDCWLEGLNASGSNSLLPDSNSNGIRDWREMPVKVASIHHVGQALIYPNPSRGTFTVNLPDLENREKAQLLLYNIKGQLVYENTISKSQNTVDVLNSKNGTYIVKIKAENYTTTNRLVINR